LSKISITIAELAKDRQEKEFFERALEIADSIERNNLYQQQAAGAEIAPLMAQVGTETADIFWFDWALETAGLITGADEETGAERKRKPIHFISQQLAEKAVEFNQPNWFEKCLLAEMPFERIAGDDERNTALSQITVSVFQMAISDQQLDLEQQAWQAWGLVDSEVYQVEASSKALVLAIDSNALDWIDPLFVSYATPLKPNEDIDDKYYRCVAMLGASADLDGSQIIDFLFDRSFRHTIEVRGLVTAPRSSSLEARRGPDRNRAENQ